MQCFAWVTTKQWLSKTKARFPKQPFLKEVYFLTTLQSLEKWKSSCLPRRVQCFQTLQGNDVLRGSSRVPAPRTNLYHDYSKSLTLSNLGKPSKVEFLRTIHKFGNKGKFRRCLCISSVHREIGHFHVVVVSCSVGKEMSKKAWCTWKIVVFA